MVSVPVPAFKAKMPYRLPVTVVLAPVVTVTSVPVAAPRARMADRPPLAPRAETSPLAVTLVAPVP